MSAKAKSLKTETLQEAYGETKEHLLTEINDRAEEIKNKGEDIYSDVRESVMEWKTQYAERWLNESTEYVKKNPIKSLLIAFGAGFILSKLFRR